MRVTVVVNNDSDKCYRYVAAYVYVKPQMTMILLYKTAMVCLVFIQNDHHKIV